MRAVVQRVSSAQVTVAGEVVGRIERGFLVLLGVKDTDTSDDAIYLAKKVAGLRVFEDAAGKMNLGLEEVGGAMLVVSQFTLYGDVRKGRRPSFESAMPPEEAERVYDAFVAEARKTGISVATGRFRATMKVTSLNDGPVTILLDSKASP